MAGQAARAQAVHGEATLSAADGFARLVLKLNQDVDSEVALAGSILVIRFKRAVDVPVDRLAVAAPGYVSSVRRDPDGSAIRLALTRKVTVNSMVAGERLFIDLLPDSWKGAPPGLPQDVVRELAERARAAERALRKQRAEEAEQKKPPVRVRASVQPTFVRYVFELPDGTGVATALGDHAFTLVFDNQLVFDLSDARIAEPASVGKLSQKPEGSGTKVEFALVGDVDVHSFREDRNFVVDIGFQPKERPPLVPAAVAEEPPPAVGFPLPGAAAPKAKPGRAMKKSSARITPPIQSFRARARRKILRAPCRKSKKRCTFSAKPFRPKRAAFSIPSRAVSPSASIRSPTRSSGARFSACTTLAAIRAANLNYLRR